MNFNGKVISGIKKKKKKLATTFVKGRMRDSYPEIKSKLNIVEKTNN